MSRIENNPAVAASQASEPGKKLTYHLAPRFKAAREGLSVLMIRQHGPAIVQLQRLLNIAGAEPPLDDDGFFGPLTQAAVRAFQRDYKGEPPLTADGKAGKNTIEALSAQVHGLIAGRVEAGRKIVDGGAVSSDARLPPPSGKATHTVTTVSGSELAPEPGRVTASFAGTRSEREVQAEKIMRANGMWPPIEGRTYVIQIDQDSPRASTSYKERNTFLRAYTGELVVFRAERRRMVEQNPTGPLRSASHPGQMSTKSKFVDVDKDGDSDIAHLRAGVYEYNAHSKTDKNGKERFNPLDDWLLAVARDVNQNGVIDDAEANARYQAAGIQFHSGARRGPTSVGCQTMHPTDFEAFRGMMPSGRGDSFTYVLVRRPNDTFGANPF